MTKLELMEMLKQIPDDATVTVLTEDQNEFVDVLYTIHDGMNSTHIELVIPNIHLQRTSWSIK